MNTHEIKQMIMTDPRYNFLKDIDNMAMITLGGSYAYGTNNENSDIDIRGCALNSKKEILLGRDFEQVVDTTTDTTIYSFNKLINLLSKCNPNTIEMLGCKKEQYLYLSKAGELLLDNTKLFLSKQCIYTFGGYATAQLRRLENKSVRVAEQDKREKHILATIESAKYIFEERYGISGVELFVDTSDKPEFSHELYANVHADRVPLRDLHGFMGEVTGIIRSYDRTGSRNSKAIEHNKLGKHMMHLLRLYLMCIDILEKEKVVTYREKEHDLLMDIRNGKYLDANQQVLPEFYELLGEYEKRFEYAKENTALPDKPDYKKIDELRMHVNEEVIL